MEQAKATPTSAGYLSVATAPGCKESVHVLVLEAFVGRRPTGMVARHLNGDPTDNRAVNLAWGTREQNYADSVIHGTAARGERNHTARLTPSQVIEIRESSEQGVVLAARLGVSKSAIYHIRNGHTWRHVA